MVFDNASNKQRKMPSKKLRARKTSSETAKKHKPMKTQVAYFFNGTSVHLSLSKKSHEETKTMVMMMYPSNPPQSEIDDYYKQLRTIENHIVSKTGLGNKVKKDVIDEDGLMIWIMNIIYLTETGRLTNDDNNGYLFITQS